MIVEYDERGNISVRDYTPEEIERFETEKAEQEKWEREHPANPTIEEKLENVENKVDDISATLVNQI